MGVCAARIAGGDGNGTGYYGAGGGGSPQRPASPGAWDSSTRIGPTGGAGSPQRRGLSPARRGFAAGGVAGSSLGMLASFGGPAPSQRGGGHGHTQRGGQRDPAVQVRVLKYAP